MDSINYNYYYFQRIFHLADLYNHVEDIELMAGIWAENPVPGGKVPHTVYCLIVDQLKRTLASDRHWYERPNRPHAFSDSKYKIDNKP